MTASRREQSVADGPWVAAAFICRDLETDDGGAASYIGQIDKITTWGVGAAWPLSEDFFWLVFGVHWGSSRGSYRLTITGRVPGEKPQVFEPVDLPREAKALSCWYRMKIQMPIFAQGIVWFDLALNGRVVSRIPFQVQRISQPQEPTEPVLPG
jgi:hypothetical protein